MMLLKNLTEIYTYSLYMFSTIAIDYLLINLKIVFLLYCVLDLKHFCQLDYTKVDKNIDYYLGLILYYIKNLQNKSLYA